MAVYGSAGVSIVQCMCSLTLEESNALRHDTELVLQSRARVDSSVCLPMDTHLWLLRLQQSTRYKCSLWNYIWWLQNVSLLV